MSVSAEKGVLLHAAVRKNEVTEIRSLLKGNAALVDFQEDGLTPLMSALARGRRDGNVNAFECLLTYRPNLNIKNKAGMTALILASCFGHIDCIRLLLSQNPLPDIDAQDNEGMTATMHAAFAGNTEAVKLISAMCEPNLALRNKSGRTTHQCAKNVEIQHILGSIHGPRLLRAAAQADTGDFKKLIELDVWLDYQDSDGKTAVIVAAMNCRAVGLKYLLTQQDKPCPRLYLRDKQGMTALMYASMRDYQIVAALLLSVPLKRLHEQDRDGTPMQDSGSTEVCMKSSCQAAFNWRCWRSACAVCGLVLCSQCASEKVQIKGKEQIACKLCKTALESATK